MINRRHATLLLGLLTFIALAPLGCGDDPMTKGKFCSAIGNSFCDRAVTCDLVTPAERSSCQMDIQADCCESDGTCGETAKPGREDDAQQFINQCTSALKTFSCAQLEAGGVPTQCTTDSLALRSSLEPPAPKSFDARAVGAAAGANF